MRLTVAICTWNRCELLRQALEQMTHLVIPTGVAWELLVVNNNCTDDTDEVIAAFASRLPIRRLFEPVPGKSNALNLAVREALGQYILWTDDDALVDQNWVAAYVHAIQRWPQAAFFGGGVRPYFGVPPPDWLTRVWSRVTDVYAILDLGTHPFRFEGHKCAPFGVNWAVRVEEQRRYQYNPRFGPKPGGTIRGEETELIFSLIDHGHEGWWVPDAIVQHHVPAERMTIAYIRKCFFAQGRYLARKGLPWNGPRLFGRPRWLVRHTATAEVQYWYHRLTASPEIWIDDLITASLAWGLLFK
jgi:glycosyltransferase involved in cell wall biosynthesis